MRDIDRPIVPWPRWRLLAILAACGALVIAVVVGSAIMITRQPAAPTATPTHAVPQEALNLRDRIAAAPMTRVAPTAARSTAPSTRLASTIGVPTATTTGPADVPSGFTHTPEGAVGQLAEIEIRVLEAMSIRVAHQVHSAWSMPGAPDAASWELTVGVQSFLAASGQEGESRDDSTLVTAIPAGAQVKGVDGPDWVLACVLLDVRASIVTEARIGWGHCERMAWSGGRWMIGAGFPPAQAPSTWPGSEVALEAGWLRWQEAQR